MPSQFLNRKRHTRRIELNTQPLLLASPLLALVIGATAIGEQSELARPPGPNASVAYCGIYAVFCAAKLLDQPDVQFERLLQPEYVGSRYGSTAAELQSAIGALGLSSALVTSATPSLLAECEQPVVLHVRSSPRAKAPDHYVLFAGMSGENAVLMDGPIATAQVPLTEVAAFWDGSAIIVSREPIGVLRLMTLQYKVAIIGIAIACVAVVLLRKFATKPDVTMGASSRSLPQAAAVLAVSLGLGCIVTGLGGDRLLLDAGAREFVRRSGSVEFLPRVSLVEARNLHANGALFVDARVEADFLAGHIPGAVNLFADASRDAREAVLGGRDPEAPIVVYCSHRDCPLAADLAADMYYAGFKRVMIFEGGWLEWRGARDDR